MPVNTYSSALICYLLDFRLISIEMRIVLFAIFLIGKIHSVTFYCLLLELLSFATQYFAAFGCVCISSHDTHCTRNDNKIGISLDNGMIKKIYQKITMEAMSSGNLCHRLLHCKICKQMDESVIRFVCSCSLSLLLSS